MAEPASFKQLQAAIENVLNSETDDIKVFAEALGLNIGQDFSGADLKDVDLSGHDLSQANFEDSDLSGANLRNVNLSYANLRGAILFDSCLDSANLSFADLRGANLQDASVDGANFFGANIDEFTKSSLNQLCIEAIKLKRPAIEMKLEFQDQNQHEAPLLNLSEIFKSFQANLNCFGQALQLIRTGSISENISELTHYSS